MDKFSEDHFMQADDETVEILSEDAIMSYKRQEESIFFIRERAYKIINLLFAGVGGSVALFFNLAEHTLLKAGLLIIAIGWTASSIWLVAFCLSAKQRQTIYSSPELQYFDWSKKYSGNLNNAQILKRLKLYDYSEGIKSTAALAKNISKNLNIGLWISAITAVICIIYACFVFF